MDDDDLTTLLRRPFSSTLSVFFGTFSHEATFQNARSSHDDTNMKHRFTHDNGGFARIRGRTGNYWIRPEGFAYACPVLPTHPDPR